MLFPFLSFTQYDSSRYLITRKLLTTTDGLASREANCGMEDSRGFLWFGTRNGLNRYDGKDFLLFTKQKNNMQSNIVFELAEDGAGNMWVLYQARNTNKSSSEMDVLNIQTLSVQPFFSAIKNIPFKQHDIRFIHRLPGKRILILTYTMDIWIYDSKKGFRWVTHCKGNNNDEWVRNDYFSEDAVVLTMDDGRINYITADTMITLEGYKYAINRSNNDIVFVNINNGGAFFSINKNYQKVPIKDYQSLGPSQQFNFYDFYTTFIYDYTCNSIVFWDNNSLVCCNGNETIRLLDKTDNDIANSLRITDCFTDKFNNKWICSSSGVWKVTIKKNKFSHYFTYEQTKPYGLEINNQTRGIYADDDGSIYASVYNFFLKCNSSSPTSNRSDYKKRFFFPVVKANDKIYVGSFDLYCWNKLTNKLDVVSSPGYSPEMLALLQLNDSLLLEGGQFGFALYNMNTHVSKINNSFNGFTKPYRVYSFIRDKDNSIWALAESAIYKLDTHAAITDCYEYGSKYAAKQLPFNTLYDFCIDKEGVFWIATGDDGLWRWDRKQNLFKQFTISEGLPSNLLYSIKEDDENNLWIGSDLGLIRFNKKDFTCYTFTTKDGLSHNEFNHFSSFKAKDGRMFFGGLNGVNAFYPKDFSATDKQEDIPLTVISVSQISGNSDKLEQKTNDYFTTGKISLNPGDRFATIEFRLLDYDDGKKRYAYKMDGLHEDWNYTYDNKISISGLPYGNYTLFIKGETAAGVWSAMELKIPVEVITPFYFSFWFIAIVSGVLIFIVYYFIRRRIYDLKIRNLKLEKTVLFRTEELNKLLSEKEMLLKEIHHRVKNNLEVIGSLLELQGETISDEKASAAIIEAQNRVQSIALIHLKLYRFDNLGTIEFISFTADLFEQVKIVFAKPADKVILNMIAEPTSIYYDAAVPLGLILNELLTNTFKYGITSHIENTVTIKLQLPSDEKGLYKIIYSDTGKGLPEGLDFQKSSSLGMRMVYILSRQLGGEVKYHFDKGSVFEISFKMTSNTI